LSTATEDAVITKSWNVGTHRGRRSYPLAAVASLIVGVVGSASCGSATVRQGQASSYLIIERLEGANGAQGDSPTFAGVVPSDVVTFVKKSNSFTIFTDPGRVTMRLALKDVTNPVGPTDNNAITVNRYRVDFRRTDGRNTPGVDVPYGFDGAMTFTVSGGESVQAVFTLVRVQAKKEPPLRSLAAGGGAITISTIADITFYGQDQTGRAVSVTGSISVNFADWGDPDA
jgi:hypothetical protein